MVENIEMEFTQDKGLDSSKSALSVVHPDSGYLGGPKSALSAVHPDSGYLEGVKERAICGFL